MAKKTNIDYLRDQLTTDEQKEFLEGVEKDYRKEVTTLEEINHGLNDEINSLEMKIDRLRERELGESIPCGIGTIRYETEGSLDLQFLMEGLAEVIQEHGAHEVLALLRNTYAV